MIQERFMVEPHYSKPLNCLYQPHAVCPNYIHMYKLTLKCGHLNYQANNFCPKGGQNRWVPFLYHIIV